ncbi:MAG: 2Fe-2S iron-sulfur cluster binding domain-containing protein [Lentisphaerae bacterium]|jgi:Na+-transporting NADH:ubiquinone oxidoreductase subunit F|nr:2Fe-2S iron-sulfur cluster binding domain-containing protein [Lentisphaerota bacterium]
MIYIQAILTLAVIGTGLTVLLLVLAYFFARYGTCKVKVNDREPFEVEGGGKLLDALYDNKIFIPSACGGQGTCGFCKTRVLSGGGPLLPTETPYLTEEEQQCGTRLACQVKIRNDIEIQVKPEFLNIKQFVATVDEATMKTGDIREIHFKLQPGDAIEFHPGQYVQVLVPSKKETIFRAYSIASVPADQDSIELLVRLIPKGLGSTYLHAIQPGDQVTFTGPYGEFILDQDPEAELVCVGGGVGMAPMRSLLRHIAQANPQKKAWLFFGARTTDQLLYLEEFTKLQKELPNFKICYALSEPEKCPDWNGETGFIHLAVEKLLEKNDNPKRQAFLCGPPQMLEAARNTLTQKGFQDCNIFADEF